MDALLDAMSPECKALIIMPTEPPIAKVCKPLNPAFRKGMQKIGDRRFRALEAAYSGYNPLDHFEADIDKLELPPLKQNVVTLVFLYVLDDHGYILDADFKVFDDEGSNSAWEKTLEADGKRSYQLFEGCEDSGTVVTPRRLFPEPRRINRDFNITIWGSPGLPAAVHPPEKIKSRLPVPATPKVKGVVILGKEETIEVTPPRALATLTSKTMIPIVPATPRSKVPNKVGLSKKVFSEICGKDPSIPLPPIRLVWGSARGNLGTVGTVPANAFGSAYGTSVPAPGGLASFSAGGVFASASSQAPGPSNAAIVRRKPAPTTSVTPDKISVGGSNKRPSSSRFPIASLVKKASVPVASKNRLGSVICTELLSGKQRLAKETKDGREGHVEKRGWTVKNAVVEKKAIKKRPSNTRLPARSKGPIISDELSDPQNPSPAYNNAINTPPSFTASNLEKAPAYTSASSGNKAVPKGPILTPMPANRESNAFSEDLIQDSANNADIANLRSENEESSAGSKPPHEPKSVKKKKPPRRRRPRIHGALSQHSDDAGDTPTAEVSPQDNAASVHSSTLKVISAPEEPSPAEEKIEEPVSPTSASKPSSPNLPPSPAPTPLSSFDLAGVPEASVTQLMCHDAKPLGPARALDNSIHQRDLDLNGLRQEMDNEFDKKLSAQAAGFEAMLKATIQTTVNGLTGEFDRKLDLQTKLLEDSIRQKDAKISLQEAEIEALKAKLGLLEQTKSSANQGPSAADDENQVGDNTEAVKTEDGKFIDAEEGTPEPAPLSSNVATTKRAQEPEIIHLPESKLAIWQRVQPKLRWLLVGTFVVLAIIAALRAFVHSCRNEELPITALPSFNTKEARLYLERLIQQGIGRREIAKIAPYLQDLEEILTSIPTRTYNMPTQTYDLGLMDSF